MAMTREVFETNTFGVMAMTQAVQPQLRARRSDLVVNVTSPTSADWTSRMLTPFELVLGR
jgi:NAD(P)-dependent dehydrogenase (short-subunit alcohol dehydrogenase family)